MENAPHRYDGDGSAKNQRRRRGEQAKVQAVCNLAHHSVFRKLFEIDEIPMRRRALGRISAFRCFKQSVLPLWQRGEHRLFLGGIQHPPIRAEKVKIFRQILVRFGAERINIQNSSTMMLLFQYGLKATGRRSLPGLVERGLLRENAAAG